jgi:hypothetical protein
MRVFGRQISKWWLLLMAPVAALASPLLLIGFFATNDLAGAIIGPPAIWSLPHHAPPFANLVGRYIESERRSDKPKSGPDAVLELNADGSMRVSNLPAEFSDQVSCTLSGSGTWAQSGESAYESKIEIRITSVEAVDPCTSAADFQIVGHSKPYSLYEYLGDPDSGTGVWLKRQ